MKFKRGYTTGVFDMFHVGHLNIFRKAKEICSELVVGVTTDELVETLKGRQPVIPFEERVQIVESCKYVDAVIPQKAIDELKDHENLSFDVIFKGSDWKNSAKWDELRKTFSKRGVEVVFFDYTECVSSTKLRAVIESLNHIYD